MKRLNFNFSLAIIILSFAFQCAALAIDETPTAKPVKTSVVVQFVGSNFEQYTTTDAAGKEVTFFVSEPEKKDSTSHLVLLINGSGCDSVFAREGGNTYGYRTDLFLKRGSDNIRLVIAEKPGVKLYALNKRNPGCHTCSDEFYREYTLDGWTAINRAALSAALQLPDVLKDRVLVFGHSDGGQVATHLARSDSRITHVASIAGGGPTQFFDSITAAAASPQPNTPSKIQVANLMDLWHDIEKDPTSITKFAWGHPYNRWSTFNKSSSLDDLLHCNTKCYLLQGTKDTSVPVAAFDVMLAELAVHDRPFRYDRIDGADHGLTIHEDGKEYDELPNAIGRILEWFAKE